MAGIPGGGPAKPDQPAGSAPHGARVFVSYAHDDATHVDRVRKFCLLLRSNGIDARMDLPAGEQRQNWPQWMTHEVRAAEWVLVIASREYKRRAEGEAGPAEGRGVQWEALQIQERIYVDQHTGLRKVVPVVLPGQSPADIPVWLAPSSTMYYVVSEFTVAGAEKLLRLLTGQAYENRVSSWPASGPAATWRGGCRLRCPRAFCAIRRGPARKERGDVARSRAAEFPAGRHGAVAILDARAVESRVS